MCGAGCLLPDQKEGGSETRLTADNIIWANATKEEPVVW